MEYKDAVAYINDKNKFGSRPGLRSIGKLLELLGNPQKELNSIHVAGTNGKGSTSAYLSNCIHEAGYKVGLFTSPYLERFNERMQINGEDMPDDALGPLTSMVKDEANKMVEEGFEHPTTFEIITAIAFLYFKKEKVEYVVLEVGLGGRYDATNIIDTSLASVITTIDYDHINVLGNTLEEIAYEKAGIIKDNGLVISYPQNNKAFTVLEDVAKEMGADFYLSPNIDIVEENQYGSIFNYNYRGQSLNDIEISMIGEYQIYNAALAVSTLLVLREKGLINIDNKHIYNGLSKTMWKGRLEVLKKDPIFLIDGAHNIQGITNLAKTLELFNYEKLILGIAILGDKDVDNMIDVLAPLADKIIATEVDMPRTLKAGELAAKLNKYKKDIYTEKDTKKAIDKAYELASKDDLIVFGGSLYLIGEVRTLVNLL